MRIDRGRTLLALVASGLLWGTTVPLTKVALEGLGPAWLTVARLTLAGVPLAVLLRGRLRAALSPPVVAWGAVGYGAVFTLQNLGVARTSVSHAALLVGTIPILVAAMAAISRHTTRRRPSPARGPAMSTWLGLAVALAGVVWIGVDGGGAADPTGDALVLGSLLLNAAFLVAQPALLAGPSHPAGPVKLGGRDPLAVTAVQLLAGALLALPVAVLTDGPPAALPDMRPLAALAGLAIGGTLVPYALFTWAQARTTAEVAGAFLNLEPLVGVLLGAFAFGDQVGPAQLAGAAAIVTGVILTARPTLPPVVTEAAAASRAAIAAAPAGSIRRRPEAVAGGSPPHEVDRSAWTGRPIRLAGPPIRTEPSAADGDRAAARLPS